MSRITTMSRFVDRFLNARLPGVHQFSHWTTGDRYPEIFTAVRNLTMAPQPRILSFGCSSGEECLSLHKWMPHAKIVGIDISRRVLKRAERNCRAIPNCDFATSLAEVPGRFDVIFAMSVLCRHPETKDAADINDIYPFEAFEAALSSLANALLPGGLLVLYNSNYRLTDTRLRDIFDPVAVEAITESGFVHKFDTSGRALADQGYSYCIFRKR